MYGSYPKVMTKHESVSLTNLPLHAVSLSNPKDCWGLEETEEFFIVSEFRFISEEVEEGWASIDSPTGVYSVELRGVVSAQADERGALCSHSPLQPRRIKASKVSATGQKPLYSKQTPISTSAPLTDTQGLGLPDCYCPLN